MNENLILEEIRKTRDKDAEECGYDVHRLFRKLREETEKLSLSGWKVVSAEKLESSRQGT